MQQYLGLLVAQVHRMPGLRSVRDGCCWTGPCCGRESAQASCCCRWAAATASQPAPACPGWPVGPAITSRKVLIEIRHLRNDPACRPVVCPVPVSPAPHPDSAVSPARVRDSADAAARGPVHRPGWASVLSVTQFTHIHFFFSWPSHTDKDYLLAHLDAGEKK